MTLIEIMISLVLLSIVSGVIMRVIMRQQRFYQGVNQIMSQRSQLRQATSILPVDLRSLSSVGDDIIAATDSSIEFMVNVGTGAVCNVIDNKQLALPPDTLASGQDITDWFGYGKPQVAGGDLQYYAYVYDDSVTLGNEDDYWKQYNLVEVHEDAAQCLTTYATVADAGKKRPILEVSDPLSFTDPVTGGPLSQYIGVGAPVRITRRVMYAYYRAADGKYYLGFARYKTGGAYEELSPVSGPYDPKGSASGVVFKYYDVDGNEIASGANAANRRLIARVDLIVRARTSANVRAAGIQGGANQQYKDSLAVSVMLRNRN
jgi:type II secretory pathway pseudopilin PulG